jgi:hypothetical protein
MFTPAKEHRIPWLEQVPVHHRNRLPGMSHTPIIPVIPGRSDIIISRRGTQTPQQEQTGKNSLFHRQ